MSLTICWTSNRRRPLTHPRWRNSRARPAGATFVVAVAVAIAGGAFPARAATTPARAAETSAAPEPARGIEARLRDLERSLAELAVQLAEARSGGLSPTVRLTELERRIEVLAGEIEKLRSGDSPVVADARGHGLGPAASKVYARDKGVSIGGYGEALYRNFASRADDGTRGAGADALDLARAVFYFGYKFERGIVFNSEIEYEHATTGEGSEERGEVSVEFAYLEFPLGKHLGLRAGQLLAPVGIKNELHEPTIYLGSRRPDVETLIIPSTWSEVGVGVFGETGPLTWRAYVLASLDASGFTAEGIRAGRQGGSNSKAHDLALTTRLDWTPVPGLLVGGSFFGGDSGQGREDLSGRPVRARTTLFDLHAGWKSRGWQLSGLYAKGHVGDVARLNDALGLTGADSVGKTSHGWYAEAGYDVLRGEARSEVSLTPFVRYERYGTQDAVPSGFARDPALRVGVATVGIEYKPIPNIVVKADYQDYKNDAGTGLDRFNVALGYIF